MGKGGKTQKQKSTVRKGAKERIVEMHMKPVRVAKRKRMNLGGERISRGKPASAKNGCFQGKKKKGSKKGGAGSEGGGVTREKNAPTGIAGNAFVVKREKKKGRLTQKRKIEAPTGLGLA